MSLKNLYKQFGVSPNIDKEKQLFVQRINTTIFTTLKQSAYPDDYEHLFRDVCYQLGLNGNDIISHANRNNYGHSLFIPSFRKLTADDFFETLKILVVLYNATAKENQEKVAFAIELALAHAAIDLGIRWKDGMFYPSGAKELDEKLLDDSLEWLNEYPEVKEQFKTALDHFGQSIQDESSRKDAITNAYTSIEKLTQILLQNGKNFEKNSNDLVNKLQLPSEYKNIIHYYKQIAHEYSSRHAGSSISHDEAEAFIYLTGILVRLMTNKT